MKVYFKSNRHAKLVNDNKQLIRKYGQRQAEDIQTVFKELDAVGCLSDIPSTLRPHPLEPKSEGKFALDLKHPFRVVVQAYGGFTLSDYSTIKEIMVIDICVNYH
jgi:hypothetical protein